MRKRETAAERRARLLVNGGFRLVRARFDPPITPLGGTIPEVRDAEVIVPAFFFSNGHSFADWTDALRRHLSDLGRLHRKEGR